MTAVSCIRCGRTLPAAEADIVGNGYRCAQCTVIAGTLGEEAEVADNVSPAQREQLAKQGKRRFFGAMASVGPPSLHPRR